MFGVYYVCLAKQAAELSAPELSSKLNRTGHRRSEILLRSLAQVTKSLGYKNSINYFADENACGTNPCQNSGICHGGFDYYYCDCPIGFAGSTCNRGVILGSYDLIICIYIFLDSLF